MTTRNPKIIGVDVSKSIGVSVQRGSDRKTNRRIFDEVVSEISVAHQPLPEGC